MISFMFCTWRSFLHTTWWVKLLGVFFVMLLSYQVLNYNHYYKLFEGAKPRSLIIDPIAKYKWHCELNKRILKELHKELAIKNKLLNYRGKVIMKLRAHINMLNQTNNSLRDTLYNLTKTISNLNSELSPTNTSKGGGSEASQSIPDLLRISQGGIHTINHLSSFEELKNTAAKASRPCCIALNRMTDILRGYMESNQELREQVDGLRHVNFTAQQSSSAGFDYTALYKLHDNFTRKPEKYATYQLYTNGFFYESVSLNRMDPKQNLRSKTFRRNYDFRVAAQAAVASISQRLHLNKSLVRMIDSLFRYDELKGATYRFVFAYNNTRKITVNLLKPYARYVSSHIQETELNPKQNELINIIVPVSNRADRLTVFLENIRMLFKHHNENLFLTIVIYGNDTNNKIKNVIRIFSQKYNFTSYDILKRNLPFNRGQVLHDGIMRWNGYPNVLLFLCDIDIKIKPAFFHRCRQNTISGKTVYMPIVFSLYNPNVVFRNNKSRIGTEAAFNISDQTGAWRPYGYGMVCMYRPDYFHVGGFNQKISGWGGEDYSLYIRYVNVYLL